MAFAARDFSPRRGASDEHITQWICKERATKSGRKRPAALRVAPNLACGFVARRSQPHCRGMLPPRASSQAKLGATNVIGFMPQTTKVLGFEAWSFSGVWSLVFGVFLVFGFWEFSCRLTPRFLAKKKCF